MLCFTHLALTLGLRVLLAGSAEDGTRMLSVPQDKHQPAAFLPIRHIQSPTQTAGKCRLKALPS